MTKARVVTRRENALANNDWREGTCGEDSAIRFIQGRGASREGEAARRANITGRSPWKIARRSSSRASA